LARKNIAIRTEGSKTASQMQSLKSYYRTNKVLLSYVGARA